MLCVVTRPCGLVHDKALVEAQLAAASIGQSNLDLAFDSFRRALQDAVDSKNGVLEADILISLASEAQLKGNTTQAKELITGTGSGTYKGRDQGADRRYGRAGNSKRSPAETPRPRRRSARQANGIGQPTNNSPAKGHCFCTKCLREATERSRNISTAICGSLTSGSPNPRRNKPDAGAKSASGEADHRTHWTIGGESAIKVHPAHARVPFPGALAPTFLIS